MDKYAMHAANFRVFRPMKKRTKNNKRQPRDPELLGNYSGGLTYNYSTLGLYK